jgi:hypothetical protein
MTRSTRSSASLKPIYSAACARLTGACGSAVAGMSQADQRNIERRGRPDNPLVDLAMFDDVLWAELDWL